jgi:DNA-binding LacI/PurR family transcriptional regulator
MKRPTITDVARQARVSKPTVSHVINRTRNVGDETRQRVLQAIHELGYRPSLIARSLATKRTHSIGIITPDVSRPFLGEMLSGIASVLGPKGYSLFLYYTAGLSESENNYLELLLRNQVDGIIAAVTSEKWHALTLADRETTPIVFMDRSFDGLAGPYVGADNENGAYMAVQHFVEHGQRDIGLLAGPQHLLNMSERLAGFRRAIRDFGLTTPEAWVASGPITVEGGYRAMLDLLNLASRPRAVLVSSEQLSLGALLALEERQVRCPQDIALISFDDYAWARVSCPPLTTVRIPNQEMGRLAAETLLTLIEGGEPPPLRQASPCELILRKSCCLEHAIDRR